MADPTNQIHGRDAEGRRLWGQTDLPYATVYNRIRRGWSLDEAVNTPLVKRER